VGVPPRASQVRRKWQTLRLVGTGQDITERKLAEASIVESEIKYRELVESLYEGVWAIDSADRTIFVNSCMAKMLDFTVEEMLGRASYLSSTVSAGTPQIAIFIAVGRKSGNAAGLIFVEKMERYYVLRCPFLHVWPITIVMRGR